MHKIYFFWIPRVVERWVGGVHFEDATMYWPSTKKTNVLDLVVHVFYHEFNIGATHVLPPPLKRNKKNRDNIRYIVYTLILLRN